jgi:hypothetical protein
MTTWMAPPRRLRREYLTKGDALQVGQRGPRDELSAGAGQRHRIARARTALPPRGGKGVPPFAARRSVATGQPPARNSGATGGRTQTAAPDPRAGRGRHERDRAADQPSRARPGTTCGVGSPSGAALSGNEIDSAISAVKSAGLIAKVRFHTVCLIYASRCFRFMTSSSARLKSAERESSGKTLKR